MQSLKKITQALSVCFLLFAMMLVFVSCTQQGGLQADGTGGQGASVGLTAGDTTDGTSGDKVAGSTTDAAPIPTEPIYSGDDPKQIITQLCAQDYCHAGNDLLDYKTDASNAALRVKTHSSVEVELTEKQQESLTEYFAQ